MCLASDSYTFASVKKIFKIGMSIQQQETKERVVNYHNHTEPWVT